MVVLNSLPQVVAVDPIGSILAQPEDLNKGGEGYPYQVRRGRDREKREREGEGERKRERESFDPTML